MVQNHVGRHAKAPATPDPGQGEMDLSWQHIRQLVEREGGLVGHDAGPLRPEPGGDQLLVLARGEMDEPVDAPTHTKGLAAVHVVDE